MAKTMQEALTVYAGDCRRQRLLFKKLIGLAEHAKADVIDFIALYCLTTENLPSFEQSPFSTLYNSERLNATEARNQALKAWLRRDEEAGPYGHYYRPIQCRDSLVNNSHRAGEPVLDWLVHYFSHFEDKMEFLTAPFIAPRLSEPQKPVQQYKCPVPGCDKAFSTIEGLRGHGPKRCLREKLKTAIPLPAHES